MIVVVMGVSGCGKSSVGRAIASRTGWTYIEGDNLHPPANREKMASGTPLNDGDRWPWLDTIVAEAQAIDRSGGSAVIACSALKRIYRDRLRQPELSVKFVHLTGERETILTRMQAREGHYMPPGLLDSQLATLEPPGTDEDVATFGIERSVEDIADDVLAALEVSRQEISKK